MTKDYSYAYSPLWTSGGFGSKKTSWKVLGTGCTIIVLVALLNMQNFSDLNVRFMETADSRGSSWNTRLQVKSSLFVEHMKLAMANDYSFDGTRDGFDTSSLWTSKKVVSKGNHVVPRPPKLVLGIFSMDSEKSAQRRQLIRDTYLTVNRRDKLRDPRVCSLMEYMNNKQDNINNDMSECVVLYVFVICAFPRDAEDQPADHFHTDREIAVPVQRLPHAMDSSPHSGANEPDVVFLNIRENMNEGKTPTYFKWASTSLPPDLNHYIAKTDDDTMIYMPALFRHIVYKLLPPPYNYRVYGGKKTDWFQCGEHEHCKSIVPHGYMTGMFFFMSADLAREATADANERDYDVINQRGKHFEDLDMGRWIFKNVRATWQPVTMMTPGLNVQYWLHPIKLREEWMDLWNGYEFDSVPYICTKEYGDPKNPC